MIRAAVFENHRFAELLAERLGLQAEGLPQSELGAVLSARLRATGCADLAAYSRLLRHPAHARAELATLSAEFAVGETYFFRGEDQWRALFETALPELLARIGPRRLRLLSAGCASGEEPYTAAMLLREWRPDLVDAVEITGIDASAPLLEKARNGRYSPWALRSTPAAIKTQYFRQHGTQFQLSEDIRRAVRFEHRNLLADDALFWFGGAFDVILCRNVFIYFTPAAISDAVARFSHALIPGGCLFLGHAETLRGISRDYHLRDRGEAFYYQLRGEGETVEFDPLFDVWRDAGALPVAADAIDAPAMQNEDDWFEISRRVTERVAAIAGRGSPLGQTPQAGARNSGGAIAPASPDTLLALAADCLERGEHARAEAICDQQLVADEFDAGAHYLAALCREQGGDDDGAVTRLHAAIYLDAGFALPHLQLGRLLRRGGGTTAARRHLRAALELLPREHDQRLALLGGGLDRDALFAFCRSELAHCDALWPASENSRLAGGAEH